MASTHDPPLGERASSPESRKRIVKMLNKVPEVTLYFWVIKILATTVGETAADFLNSNIGVGLTGTTLIMAGFLAAALFFQFRLHQYVPAVYWLSVVLISVVGTLFSDNLVDNYGVSLPTTTVAFAITLAVVFAGWYWKEGTLSIHSIVTSKREAFYWLTVLFTFALGTSAGDLTAERLAVGYWQSAVLFGSLIALTFISHLRFNVNAILAFWIAYILTRPLGASIGDYLSQARVDGGLGVGTTVTSMIFLLVILGVVVFLSITKKDRIEARLAAVSDMSTREKPRVLIVANKTAATPALLDAVRKRATAGPASFVLLVPNPDHLIFDRNSTNVREGEQVLALALPLLEAASGASVEGRVATSPNAYDDIVAELDDGTYDEVMLSTLPHHVSHWLHVDLPQRVAHLGYPLTTVTATRHASAASGRSSRITPPSPAKHQAS